MELQYSPSESNTASLSLTEPVLSPLQSSHDGPGEPPPPKKMKYLVDDLDDTIENLKAGN